MRNTKGSGVILTGLMAAILLSVLFFLLLGGGGFCWANPRERGLEVNLSGTHRGQALIQKLCMKLSIQKQPQDLD